MVYKLQYTLSADFINSRHYELKINSSLLPGSYLLAALLYNIALTKKKHCHNYFLNFHLKNTCPVNGFILTEVLEDKFVSGAQIFIPASYLFLV